MDPLAEWSPLLTAFAVGTALAFVPGLLVAGAFGVRGVSLMGVAPPLSVTLVAVGATAGPIMGLAWNVVPLTVLTAVVAGLALAAGLLARRFGWTPSVRESQSSLKAALGAMLIGLVVAAVALIPGWDRPDALSQTFDATFHYNAVRLAVDTGDASPFQVGTLIEPGAASSFYPGGWHAFVALVVQLGTPEIAVAANGVSLTLAGLVWPIGCVFLVRQVLGDRWAPLLIAGTLCGAFVALPTRILAFGVLFPNTLGYVLVPTALSLCLAAWGLARDDNVGRLRGWALLLAVIPGMGIAHPNAVFALFVLALPAAAAAYLGWVRRRWRAGRTASVFVPVIIVFMSFFVIVRVLSGSPDFGRVSEFDWPARMTVAQATGEVVLLAAVGGRALWILSALVLVGATVACRQPRIRWLVASYLLAGGLYVLAAGSEDQRLAFLTGPWYNDAFRLAAMLPILGVPLAVLGIVALAEAVGRWWTDRERVRRTVRDVALAPTVVMVAIAALVLAVTGTGYAALRRGYIADSYRLSDTHAASPLVTLGELQLFQQTTSLVPEDALIAGNPWTGSGLVYAIADRQVVFPHVEGTWDRPRIVIAERLRDVARDPEVCRAVRDLKVGYALGGGEYLWNDDRATAYPGLEDLDRADGFELVATSGETRLYRMTSCAGSTPA